MLAKEQKMYVSLCVTLSCKPSTCLCSYYSVPTVISTVCILFASEIDTLISFFEGTLLAD